MISSIPLQIKVPLKQLRWQMRRWLAGLRWGFAYQASLPAVLGNAMPKSGSHLIIQVLQGLTRIGPFVNPGFPPLNRAEDNRKLDEAEILRNLQRLRAGDIAYGYLQAREPFLSICVQPGRAMIFVYRDPRDMLVSHVFYATQIHRGHGMHEYYTRRLQDMEQRLNAAIYGVDEPQARLAGVRQKYLAYLGWLEMPGVLCLRFEDLILNRRQALRQILDYLQERGFERRVSEERALTALEQAIVPRRSGTFRKAQPGNWREYFSEANKTAFKNIAGDILIQLGYEKDNEW